MLQNERLITLSAAARWIAGRTDRKTHVSTVYRWAAKGLARNGRLETIRVGGIVYTSREALERFFSREHEDVSGDSSPATIEARRRSQTQAKRILDSAGI